SVGNVFIKCDAGNGYLDHLANSCLVHNRYPQWIFGETPWPHTFIYCYYIFHILWVFYGFIISLTTYHVTGQFIPYYLLGLPFDTNHAFGNAVFVTLLYPIISRFFKKYADNRFHIQNTN